jgi:hypothetical protein
MTIDTAAVGAVQVREDHLALVFLQLGMQPADAFIVQLNIVVLFATDGDRSFQVAKQAAAFQPFEN